MFSIDVSGLLSYAADFFNQLFPAFVPVVGITLGVALVLLVLAVISGAVSKAGKGR